MVVPVTFDYLFVFPFLLTRAYSIGPVSYTHLDVYKRQNLKTSGVYYITVHALDDDLTSLRKEDERLLSQNELSGRPTVNITIFTQIS